LLLCPEHKLQFPVLFLSTILQNCQLLTTGFKCRRCCSKSWFPDLSIPYPWPLRLLGKERSGLSLTMDLLTNFSSSCSCLGSLNQRAQPPSSTRAVFWQLAPFDEHWWYHTFSSTEATKAIARPFLSARPVRPIRWM